jgi:hypothetical protein
MVQTVTNGSNMLLGAIYGHKTTKKRTRARMYPLNACMALGCVAMQASVGCIVHFMEALLAPLSILSGSLFAVPHSGEVSMLQNTFTDPGNVHLC